MRKATIIMSVCLWLPVRPHGKTRLTLNGFSRNVMHSSTLSLSLSHTHTHTHTEKYIIIAFQLKLQLNHTLYSQRMHYGLDGPGFYSRYGLQIFLFSKTPRPALGPSQPPIQRVPGLFFGGTASWAWSNHSSTNSTKVKNEWTCTCMPPISLHSVVRENFYFYTLCSRWQLSQRRLFETVFLSKYICSHAKCSLSRLSFLKGCLHHSYTICVTKQRISWQNSFSPSDLLTARTNTQWHPCGILQKH